MLEMKVKLQPRNGMTVNEKTINKRVIRCNQNCSIDKMFT